MKQFFQIACCAVVLCGSGFLAGRHQLRQDSIECTIESVVKESTEINSEGVKPPYTVVVYQPAHETFLIPGVLGAKGNIVHVPKR